MIRRTGKTFRMLLNSLIKASEGNKVCIVSINRHYASDLFKSLLRMAEGYLSKDFIKIHSPDLRIKLGEHGEIRIISGDYYTDNSFKGIQFDTLFEDNSMHTYFLNKGK